jgi:hypothetical protein
MKRVAGAAAAAGVLLAFASGASAQQIVDVEAKIASLVANAIEERLRSQLGVSKDQAPHADLDYDAKSITNQIIGHPTMKFTPQGELKVTPMFVGCGFGCNDTSTEEDPLELKYRQGDEVSQSAEWSVALKVSSEFEFGSNVEFEGLGGIEDKIKVGVSLSTEFMNGHESSQSIEWTTTYSVNTPPYKSLQAVMVVQKVGFDSVDFTLDTELKGGVNVPNLTYKFTDSHGKTVKSGKTTLAFQIEDAYPEAADRTIEAKGSFTGDQWGIQADFYTFNEKDRPEGQCPPPEGAPDCATSMPSNSTKVGTKPVSLPNP